MSWWRAEANANDTTGNNHGVLSNGVSFVTGKVGTAFSFDGVDDFIEARTNQLHFGTNDFTIEAWIQTTATKNYSAILSFDNYSPGFYIRYDGSLHLYDANASPAASLNDGQFHHVGVTRQNGALTYYKDGAVIGTTTYMRAINPQRVLLGWSTYGGEYFPGLIDEISVYNRALSTAEIQQIFTSSSAGKCAAGTGGCPAITLAPSTIPGGTVGSAYNQTLTASGGAAPYAFTLASGALPAAVSLSSAGVLSGTPNSPGTFNFTVRATDAAGCGTTQAYSATIAAAGDCTPVTAGLTSWYRGENTATDSSGSNHGTLQMGAAFAPGKVGQAFSLDGVDDYVSLGNPASLKFTGSISVSAWIKPSDFSGGLKAIVTKWGQNFTACGPGSAADSYGLFLQKENNALQLFAAIHRSDLSEPNLAGGIIPSNVFTHVAMTYDAATGFFATYTNGVQARSASFTPLGLCTSEKNVLIGGEDSFLPRRFPGLIDEVQIFERALSASEIQAIVAGCSPSVCPTVSGINPTSGAVGSNVTISGTNFTGVTAVKFANNFAAAFTIANDTSITATVPAGAVTGPITITKANCSDAQTAAFTVSGTTGGGNCATLPTGLVAWYRAENNKADDSGPDAKHGALENGTTFAAGKVGQAFSFDGVDDDVLLPAINAGSQFSMELWFYPTSLDRFQHLISDNWGSATFGALYWDRDGPAFYHANSQVFSFILPFKGLTNWMHLALTYDGSNLKCYVNGQAFVTNTGTSLVLNNPLKLGYAIAGSDARFRGLIDEVSIYNRALNANEVAAIFNAGSGGKCTATTPSCPTVSGINPTTGAIGSSVTISGANLTGVSALKFANNVSATFTVVNDTTVTATVPSGAATGVITISKANCADTQSTTFTIDTTGGTNLPGLKADYQFQSPNPRRSSVGTPPDLIDLLAPGSSTANSLITDTVDCATARTVLNFPAGNGLTLATSGIIPSNTYSIVILFKFTQQDKDRAIVDFKDGLDGRGVYANSQNNLDFKNSNNNAPGVSIGSGGPFVANTYVQVVLTRTASSANLGRAGVDSGYINGALAFRNDNPNADGVINSGNLRFFRNQTNQSFFSAGAVARIRLYDHALTADEVAALDRLPNGACPTNTPSTDGNLDPSFNGTGKVTTDINANASAIFAMAFQADGKIVVAGFAFAAGTLSDFTLARYTSTGALDPSFGVNGKVLTHFNGADEARAIAIQPDGKIIVAGYSYGSDVNNDFALARYTTTGTLDPSFGTNGKVTTDFNGEFDQAYALALQSDGKIVVAGRTGSTLARVNFGVARYTSAGELDASFGTNGKVSTDFNGSFDEAYAVAIQTDGKIVLAGRARTTLDFDPTKDDVALVRYTSTGALDASFGVNGKVITDFNGFRDAANAIAIQSDGKIVLAGHAGTSAGHDFAMARYTSTGTLDAGFGVNGKVITDFAGSTDEAYSMAIQSDGKFVIAGTEYSGDFDFGLARYTSSGALDASFGANGKVTTDFGSYDVARAVAIQSDGKIVAAGYALRLQPRHNDFALARYGNGSPGDNATGMVVTPVSLDFGTISAGATNQLTLAITNAGSAMLAVKSLSIDNAAFGLAQPFAPFNLGAGAGTTIRVEFHPNAAGTFTGALIIGSDPAGSSVAVTLNGVGAGLPPRIAFTSTVDFGSVRVGTARDVSFVISNTGSGPLTIASLTAGNSRFAGFAPVLPLTIPAGGKADLLARFFPDQVVSYTTTLAISSNDPNQGTANISLTGLGIGPAFGGSAVAWGFNGAGQLGNGTFTTTNSPTAVNVSGALAGKTVIALAAGGSHTLALTLDGRIFAWGANYAGQLGDGTITTSAVPVAVVMNEVLAGKVVTAISAGLEHSLALTLDGKVYAWGRNTFGQLGDGSTAQFTPVPVPIRTEGPLSGKSVTAIAAGAIHSLAVSSDGKVLAWGWGNEGQLGNGLNSGSPVPVAVDASGVLNGKVVTAVAAGRHSLALTSDRHVFAWGLNDSGQLGNGSSGNNSLVPVAINLNDIVAIAAGDRHSMARTFAFDLWMWGDNQFGQLGKDLTANRSVPVLVDRLGSVNFKPVILMAAGTAHSLAVTSDEKAFAWGANGEGQLGTGRFTAIDAAPLEVNTNSALQGAPVFSVAAGPNYSLAIAGPGTTTSPGCPAVSGLSPASAGIGSSVTISGANFTGVATVKFANNIAATFIVVSDATITATVPAGAATGAITITKTSCPDAQTETFTVNGTSSGNCSPLPSGLVAWYRAENDARDATAGANHGTLEAGTAFASGKVGRAFSLDGVDDDVLLPTLNVGDKFTVELWFFATSQNRFQHLVSDAEFNTRFGSLFFDRDAIIYYQNGTRWVETLLGSATTGQWTHVALTFDGSVTPRLATVYLQGTNAMSRDLGPASAAPVVFNNALKLGYSLDSQDNRFKGLLDEVSIYNRALSANEIAAIFAAASAGKCTSTSGGGCPAITLSPGTLPGGVVGTSYRQTVTASGGSAPYSFLVSSGTLPSGVTVSTAGVLSGTATTAGSYNFSLRAADANGCATNRDYVISISGNQIGPFITSIDPTNGPPGSVILLNGGGFSPVIASNRVEFNGLPVQVLSATPFTLGVVTPLTASLGTAFVAVTVAGRTSAPAGFEVTAATAVALSVVKVANQISLSWPANAAAFQLESTLSLAPPANWTTVTDVPAIVAGRNVVTLPRSEITRFFRLRGIGNVSAVSSPAVTTGQGTVLATTGGTVATADNSVAITIPPGALAQDTQITISSVIFPATGVEAPSADVFLSPDGLSFSTPVTLKIQTAGSQPPGTTLSVQLLSGAHPPQDVGGETSYFQTITNYVFNPATGQLEVPLTHFSALSWFFAKNLYAVLDIPPKYLSKGDLIYVLTGATGNQGGDWLPGHCGLYLGSRQAFDDSNDQTTIIESTQTRAAVLGEVRFDKFSSPDKTGFNDLGGTHIYMGARRPAAFNLTDNQRTDIAEWAIAQVGLRYLIVGGGAFLANEQPLVDGYTCVGLTELAYEFGIGKRIVPWQAARVLFTPFRQFQWTVPVNNAEIDVNEDFFIRVVGVVNRGLPGNDYYTQADLYDRKLDLEDCNQDARTVLTAGRARFIDVNGLFTFVPTASDAGKDFRFAFTVDATKSGAGTEKAVLIVSVNEQPPLILVRQDPPIFFNLGGSGADLVITNTGAYVSEGTNKLWIRWPVPPAQLTTGQVSAFRLEPDPGTAPAQVRYGNSSQAFPRRLFAHRDPFFNEAEAAFVGYPGPPDQCESSRVCYTLSRRALDAPITTPPNEFRVEVHVTAYGGLTFGGSGKREAWVQWNYVQKP